MKKIRLMFLSMAAILVGCNRAPTPLSSIRADHGPTNHNIVIQVVLPGAPSEAYRNELIGFSREWIQKSRPNAELIVYGEYLEPLGHMIIPALPHDSPKARANAMREP